MSKLQMASGWEKLKNINEQPKILSDKSALGGTFKMAEE